MKLLPISMGIDPCSSVLSIPLDGARGQTIQINTIPRLSLFEQMWSQQRTLVTTSFVLLELTALFNHFRFSKSKQLHFFDNMLLDPSIEVIQIDEQLERRA
jgi:hypothetical protein